MSKLIFITCLTFSLFGLSDAKADSAISPLSLSAVPPVQFPGDDFTIVGSRISLLWGRHRYVYGLDFGVLGNITEQGFAGVAVSGLFNITHGMTTGLGFQAAGLANINTQKTNIFGVQLAGLVNSNSASSSVVGLQLAALSNLSGFTTIYGAQVALFNRAESIYGFQIGLVNITNNLHGIQIGLLNFHHQGLISVSPILNIGF